MIREEILNMRAGAEMDKLIDDVFPEAKRFVLFPDFSTDIKAAWRIVEELCDKDGCDVVKVCKRDPSLLRGDWSCNFGMGHEAFGDSAPLAICRAALLVAIDS